MQLLLLLNQFVKVVHVQVSIKYKKTKNYTIQWIVHYF